MLSYKMDFNFCACKLGFVKSSHIYDVYSKAPIFWVVEHQLLYTLGNFVKLFVTKYHYFVARSKLADTTLALDYKKLKPMTFLNFHYRCIHQYRLCICKLLQIICWGCKLWKKSTYSVITFHKHIQMLSLG